MYQTNESFSLFDKTSFTTIRSRSIYLEYNGRICLSFNINWYSLIYFSIKINLDVISSSRNIFQSILVLSFFILLNNIFNINKIALWSMDKPKSTALTSLTYRRELAIKGYNRKVFFEINSFPCNFIFMIKNFIEANKLCECNKLTASSPF